MFFVSGTIRYQQSRLVHSHIEDIGANVNVS